MNESDQVLQNIRDASADLQIPGLQNLEGVQLISQALTPHSILKCWKLQKPDGTNYVVKSSKQDIAPQLTTAAINRDVAARNQLLKISERSCPKILGICKAKGFVVEEAITDHEILQQRLLVDGKVDHGLTCNLSRLLAKIHRSTQKENNAGENFKDLCSQFGGNAATESHLDSLFVQPFQESNIGQLSPSLKTKAQDLMNSPQFGTNLDALKQILLNDKECLIHGNLNTASILTKDGNVQFYDACHATMGPKAFDLGTLIAHYIITYHSQMLTEENNDIHRQVSYAMMDAIRKTVDTYIEEYEAIDISQVSGFAGIELLRRALMPESCQVSISESAREEIFGSGNRLLNGHGRIDNTGRMLMIGLQLC